MWGHSALSACVAVLLFCGQAESSFSWEKVTYEKTKSLSSKDLAACYDFLCQTMRNNDDAHFYTQVGIDLGTQPIWVLLLQKPWWHTCGTQPSCYLIPTCCLCFETRWTLKILCICLWQDSFVSHLQSLEQILIARRGDGQILGFGAATDSQTSFVCTEQERKPAMWEEVGYWMVLDTT